MIFFVDLLDSNVTVCSFVSTVYERPISLPD